MEKKVKSSIPRGFCRYFILSLLKTEQYTGKEIIDYASKKSNRLWIPSSGLIYPLLNRLIVEELIKQNKDGTHKLTEKGIKTANNTHEINNIIFTQLDVLFRLGDTEKSITNSLLEKFSVLGNIISSNLEHLTNKELKSYENFLISELEKIKNTK